MAKEGLKHADKTAVTAQEAYDAFMNTRVLLVGQTGTTYEANSMVWYDNNSAQNDTANVGYVELSYVTKAGTTVVINEAQAGDPHLVPTSGK